jgi:hypothetical protein
VPAKGNGAVRSGFSHPSPPRLSTRNLLFFLTEKPAKHKQMLHGLTAQEDLRVNSAALRRPQYSIRSAVAAP